MPKAKPVVERLRQYTVDANGCWLWNGSRLSNGYGRIRIGYGASRAMTVVHRVSYETFRGPIPEGHEIDHICRQRRCMNPGHLEAVTHRENTTRRNAALGWRTNASFARPT